MVVVVAGGLVYGAFVLSTSCPMQVPRNPCRLVAVWWLTMWWPWKMRCASGLIYGWQVVAKHSAGFHELLVLFSKVCSICFNLACSRGRKMWHCEAGFFWEVERMFLIWHPFTIQYHMKDAETETCGRKPPASREKFLGGKKNAVTEGFLTEINIALERMPSQKHKQMCSN